ncbi:MAG: arsenic efflux protein [Alphaproteobacteria bacterium]|mgnify:CR=1 FL=1|nr:arsenic efflux protein [Alphaproteobacteria bacterium]
MVNIWDIVTDSFFDTLNLVPFLFIAYLILEFIEHTSQKNMVNIIKKSNKYGPLFGAICGLFPHCGFSAVASSFYSTRVITIGTLFAVFIATSDEMVPIFLSKGISLEFIFELLSIKFICALVVGFVLDFIFKKKKQNIKIKEFCDCSHCHCGENILYSAFEHTVKIIFLIFIVSFIFGSLVEGIGEEKISMLLSDHFIFSKFIVTGIGLIPNCAASVILSKLYLNGAISVSSLLSGLLVGAGVGLVVLFKMNKDMKENLKILGMLYAIGVILGFILELILHS